MKTIEELGKLIRAKAGNAYDDLTDEEIGRLAKAKYPGSYDDYTDVDPRTALHIQELTEYYNPKTRRHGLWPKPL